MEVYWLEQAAADVPAADDWLGPGEATQVAGLRFPKRRMDWRLGRWTAKLAASAYLKGFPSAEDLTRIEIRAAPSGAPELFLAGEPAPATISVSHRGGRALCAISASGTALGCDIEVIEPRCETFLHDYLTAAEQRLLARTPETERSRLATLLWSAKESVLKALRTGLRADTRSVEVRIADPESFGVEWQPLRAHNSDGRHFHGWWRFDGGMVRTVMADPPVAIPILLPTASRTV